jgi:hypothetical protein
MLCAMSFRSLLILLVSLSFASAQEGTGNRVLEPEAGKTPGMTIHVGAMSSDTLDPELKKLCDAFFAKIKTGDVADAYREFLSGSEIGKQPALVTEFVSKTREILRQHGKMVDIELLKQKSTGKHLRLALFQLSCEHHPTQWRIYAYVVNGRWEILNIEVTSDLPKMLE